MYRPIVANSSPAPFQMHSKDYLVRLTASELESVSLCHLCTVEELDLVAEIRGVGSNLRAGSTEWQGEYRGQIISLAWDWVRSGDGMPEVLRVVGPRTNVRLIDARGYDSPAEDEQEALWQWIGALTWQREAVAALAACPPHEGLISGCCTRQH